MDFNHLRLLGCKIRKINFLPGELAMKIIHMLGRGYNKNVESTMKSKRLV